MSKEYVLEPDWLVTPGETIQDFLDRLGMTQSDLAERLGMSTKHVNELIRGKTSICLRTSVLLSRVLGGDSDYWLRLQQLYDREKIRLAEDNQQYKYLLETPPVKELIRRNYLDYVEGRDMVDTGIDNLLRFFGTSSVEILRSQYPINVSLRKSTKVQGDPLALLCWLRCCELECEKIQCQEYDAGKFTEALREIRSMTSHLTKGFFARIQEMCAACGVAVVAVKEFKNAAVNGAAAWRGKKAFIMMNLRGKCADVFWFSFFHEAGHILKGSKQHQHIEGWASPKDYDSERYAYDIEEQKANSFARDFLIPPRFQKVLSTLKSRQQIRAFAQELGIHPGIVVGRLQHDRCIRPNVFNDLRPRFCWG